MGHLLFLLGCLDTKRRMNQKSYELMSITTRLRNLQSNISFMKQAQASVENSVFSIADNARGLALNAYQFSVNGANAEANKVLEANKDMTSDAAKNAITAANAVAQKKVEVAAGIYQTQVGAIATIKQFQGSIFETANKLQLESASREESQIEQEKESLEAELEILKSEYENDKKARQDAAKDVAPSFGL